MTKTESLLGPARSGRSAGRRRVRAARARSGRRVRRHGARARLGSTHMRVRTSPGQTAPTHTPASSAARMREPAFSAAFESAYAGVGPCAGAAPYRCRGGRAAEHPQQLRRRARRAQVVLQGRVQVGELAVADETLRMRPPPWRRMPRSSARASQNGPSAFVRSAADETASDQPPRTPPRCSPARRVRRPPPRRTRRTRARSANRRRPAAARTPRREPVGAQRRRDRRRRSAALPRHDDVRARLGEPARAPARGRDSRP